MNHVTTYRTHGWPVASPPPRTPAPRDRSRVRAASDRLFGRRPTVVPPEGPA